jgi:hypothetical protein
MFNSKNLQDIFFCFLNIKIDNNGWPIKNEALLFCLFEGPRMFPEKLFLDEKDREFSALQEYKFVY